MKKIGIVTHYYNSINYGGNLQAYALCSFLNQQGYYAEQICYIFKPTKRLESVWDKIKRKGIRNIISLLISRIRDIFRLKKVRRIEKLKQQAFEFFNSQSIPHSAKVYTDDTIQETLSIYDSFITGSDQVWNGYSYAWYLDFVPENRIKISYAASLGRSMLTEKQKEQFQISLKSYKAISLREHEGLELIKDLCTVEPCITVDPVFLLTRNDWDKICASPVDGKEYIFCYFLEGNQNARKLAQKLAKKLGISIFTIPMLAGGVAKVDRKFGDKKLYDATPQQFLSLIKHAKYVFTDSFHAVVFSNIYQKNYFVFNRNKKGEMNSRIINITQLLHQEERFCNGQERESMEYIQSLSDIDYTRESKEFEELKEKSIEFLKENLG
ncbi:MAG: polysaccharide pyruvyl transferase family protein [Clostridia bacterium]|nr:polysaccharide pyruvyl transferase family protein [Clostridia bacterium]